MSDVNVELAKYNLEINRRAYKTYVELIEIAKELIKDFRGTETAKICYVNISNLTDMLEDLKKEAEEYKRIIGAEEIEEPKEENIKEENVRVLNGDLYEGGKA
jgi:hypothetical protein